MQLFVLRARFPTDDVPKTSAPTPGFCEKVQPRLCVELEQSYHENKIMLRSLRSYANERQFLDFERQLK